jgi:hypothetical protein
MRFGRSFALSKALCFPVRKSVIKDAFNEFVDLSCHFGSLSDHFRFDSRCFERPTLNGLVVASLSFSRARTAIMQVFPIGIERYSDEARSEFTLKVVPYLQRWLSCQLEKPDTAVLGYEQLIVTWNGSKHGYATVRYL